MKKSKDFKRELADKLDMPEDILYNAPKLSLTDGRRTLIENHRGVLEYGKERVVVNLGRGRIIISGSELRLKAMNRTELLVRGRIRSVEWE